MVEPTPTARDPLRRARFLFLAALLGAVLALLVVTLVVRLSATGGLVKLESEDLEEAARRWAAADIQNYSIQIEVAGRQPAIYDVLVRGGQVRTALRNGLPLKQRRTFVTWTVPGMFETIRRDVANVQRAATGDVDPQVAGLTLRGSFDPVLGYPVRYLRTQHGGGTDNPVVSWEVTKFDVSDDAEAER